MAVEAGGGQNKPPEDGKYGSVSVNETGKVEAPPSSTDQV